MSAFTNARRSRRTATDRRAKNNRDSESPERICAPGFFCAAGKGRRARYIDKVSGRAVLCWTGAGGCAVRVIYIDVLLLVNFIVNYFLILGACFFTKEPVRRGRFALAALLGSALSLVLLLPPQPLAAALLIKLAGSALLALASFGFRGLRCFLRGTAALFLSSALFAGAIAGLAVWSRSDALVSRNLGVYIDLSPTALIAAAAAIYLLLCLYDRLFKRPAAAPRLVEAELPRPGGGTVRLRLLPDSGKQLTELVSGREVLVLRQSCAGALLDEAQQAAARAVAGGGVPDAGCGALALVPYRTVRGDGVLLCFRFARCTLRSGNKHGTAQNVYAGFVPDETLPACDGLIGEDVVEEIL